MWKDIRMVSAPPARVDIRDILARKAIEIYFQPIVLERHRSVVGVEALCRGRDRAGDLVSPAALFRSAAEHQVTFELDQMCRRIAVEQFVPLLCTNAKLVLFVNTHASTLAHDVENLDAFVTMLQQHEVDPRNVAVEFLKAELIDAALLRAAVDGYNQHGFLVVLNDVGVGYSNLERIMLMKPDMLKADRALVHDLHRDLRKQGVLKALMLLSERIGGWLVVEGVETRDDAVVALDLGADMLQGFFFGRPQPAVLLDSFHASVAQVTPTAAYFQQYTLV
jgi:EAL domain-containing protein (putative c-di-GMP-specific phosphodiesterase class I)